MTRTLYRDAALADGRSDRLQVGVSVLVEDGTIRWIRPVDDEGDPGGGIDRIDASGTTIVPGMVDSHSHVTLPGGAHWIDRAARAARFVRAALWQPDTQTLHRRWRAGEAGIAGYCEDYAGVVWGCLELLQATGDPAWLA